MVTSEKQKDSTDPLFHGHVVRPVEFLVAYILGGIVIAALAVLVARYVFFWTEQNEKVSEQQVIFESYSINGEDTRLVSSDNQLFEVSGSWQDADSLERICGGGRTITVFSKAMKSKGEGDFYSVKALYDGEECLLSFEEANKLHIAKTWPMMLFPLAFVVIWGLLFAGTIIVGRNPSHYSKFVVRLLFRDGYIRY